MSSHELCTVPVCNSIWILCVTSRFLNFTLFLYFFLCALHFFHMNVLNLNVNWSRTFAFNTGSSCQHHLLLSMIVLLISLDSSLGEPLWSSYLQRKLGRVSLEHPLQPLSLHLWWAFFVCSVGVDNENWEALYFPIYMIVCCTPWRYTALEYFTGWL